MVGFPNWADRLGDQLPLRLGARSSRAEVPDASAEISAARKDVGVECDHGDEGDDFRQSEFHGSDHDVVTTVSRTNAAISRITTAARPT